MKWRSTQWNQGIAVELNKTGGFGVTLQAGAHLNAVEADYPGWKLGQKIAIDYVVRTRGGKPKFFALDKQAPANFSVMIATGQLENRWYMAGTSYALLQKALDKPVQHWSIALRPKFWSDVNGKQDPEEFKKALSDSRIVQIVFGGKFRAHGIEVQFGTARVTIQKVTVT